MNVEQGVWRRCMGYCVLVRDGKVYKYYNESQADPEIISVRKPSTLSAFKSRCGVKGGQRRSSLEGSKLCSIRRTLSCGRRRKIISRP